MARPKLVKVVTPPGIASYPHLTAPDTYKGKTEYKTALILDPSEPDVQAFMEKVQAAAQKAYDEGKAAFEEQLETAKGKRIAVLKEVIEQMSMHLPWEDEYSDDGETTGRIVCKFKALAGGTYKSGKNEGKTWKRELPLFDTQKNALNPDDVRLWGGSVIRVQAEMNPYAMETGDKYAGVSLRLFSVQVIELSDGGGDAADGFGVEDGYVGQPSTPDAPSESTDSSTDGDEEEDF